METPTMGLDPHMAMGGAMGMATLTKMMGGDSVIGVGVGLIFMTWALNMIRGLLTSLFMWIRSRFYYTARISFPDPAFIWMLEWLSVQPVFGSRGVSVLTRYNEQSEMRSGKPDFKLLPTGTQYIMFEGHIVQIARESSEKRSMDGSREDYLDVTVMRGNIETVRSLISTAMEYSITLNKDKTKIFTLEPHSQFWECISVQPKRVIESVILDINVRNHIMNDVGGFIDGKQWYINTGVPYRRGYLLYGPPGTGKTSFILSIAGKFGLSISIMNMSKGIHDGNIHSIIQKTPKETILVLEDIDAAFVKRKGRSDVLTFSGLLNALDGLASSDGRILIMTTNHIDRLSPALIRPGRVDIKIKFDYASKYQVTQMFDRFFGDVHKEIIGQIIERLTTTNISTAQLQGWFIIHRDDPSKLLDTVSEFIEQCNREYTSSHHTNGNNNMIGGGSPTPATVTSDGNNNTDTTVTVAAATNGKILANETSGTDSDDEESSPHFIRRRTYYPSMVDSQPLDMYD
eukprot:gene13685-16122_t